MELFITGESYAGAYIPWMAEHIVEEQLLPLINSTLIDDFYYSVSEPEEQRHMRCVAQDDINLVGIAIGNGVIDYMHQEPSYAEYAYTHGLIPLGAKRQLDYEFQRCLQQVLCTHTVHALSRAMFQLLLMIIEYFMLRVSLHR